MVQSSKLMYFRAPGNLKKEKNISETQAIDMLVMKQHAVQMFFSKSLKNRAHEI